MTKFSKMAINVFLIFQNDAHPHQKWLERLLPKDEHLLASLFVRQDNKRGKIQKTENQLPSKRIIQIKEFKRSYTRVWFLWIICKVVPFWKWRWLIWEMFNTSKYIAWSINSSTDTPFYSSDTSIIIIMKQGCNKL